MMRRALLGLLLFGASAGAARAQLPRISGYYLDVWVGSDQSAFADASLLGFQRFRLMTSPTYGRWGFDVAYEHALTVRSDLTAGFLGPGGEQGRSAGDWLPLQGTIEETEHVEWRHRLDRLSVAYLGDAFDVTVGRQPVSWGTTLYLTPADPFQPFDPSDPFREYRVGVDAARVSVFTGPMTEIEAVVRPADTFDGTTVTALARARTALGRWDLVAWAGVVHDEPSVSAAATVTVAGAALRSEAVLRRSKDRTGTEETVLRFTVGADRSFNLFGRNLYLVAEYQRDGFGAASAEELIPTALSPASLRGEMQVLGRDEIVALATYEWHALWSLNLLSIWNLNDTSLLFSPAVSFSASDEVVAQAGMFLGAGEEALEIPNPLEPVVLPGSEYGAVPATGYVSVTIFF
jgi:hypothetical protein